MTGAAGRRPGALAGAGRGRRLDLGRIDVALAELSEAEGVPPDVTRRLGTAYAYADRLLAEGVELGRYGTSPHLLELNHRVLCGVDPERRRQFAGHIAETTRRFYEPQGVGALYDWIERRRALGPAALAAGAFVHVVSAPQLFVEGNRRTAAVLASYFLVRGGRPPFVVTAPLLRSYLMLADRCTRIAHDSAFGTASAALWAFRMRRFVILAGRDQFLLPDETATCPV